MHPADKTGHVALNTPNQNRQRCRLKNAPVTTVRPTPEGMCIEREDLRFGEKRSSKRSRRYTQRSARPPARCRAGDAPSRLRKLTNPGQSSMPSSVNESVWLADRNAENSLNSLTAYRTDVGVQLRLGEAGMEETNSPQTDNDLPAPPGGPNSGSGASSLESGS